MTKGTFKHAEPNPEKREKNEDCMEKKAFVWYNVRSDRYGSKDGKSVFLNEGIVKNRRPEGDEERERV